MTFALGVGPVNAVKNNTATATVAVTLAGTTIGRHIVVGCWWHDNSSTITSITCTGESNLTVHGSPFTATHGPTSWQFASLANNTTGGSKTLTLTLSANSQFMGIFAIEFAGGNTSSFFHAVNGTKLEAPSSGTNPTGSVTTTADNCLIVAGSTDTAGTTTAGAGYTGHALGPLVFQDEAEYDLDAGPAGVISVPFVNAGAGQWSVLAAAFNIADVGGQATFNLPPITLSATGTMLGAIFDLPPLTLAAGNPRAIFNLPALVLSAAGEMEPTGTAEFNLPAITLVATGSMGGAGLAAFFLPAISIAAEGITGGVGTAAFDLPKLTISTDAQQAGLGNASFNLPSIVIAATGLTGGVGTAAFKLPVIALSVAAQMSGVGEAAFNIPRLTIDAQGTMVLVAAYRTWVVNLRKGAITEYNNFNFNSFAYFNGQVLACGPSGVFTLGTQSTDAGTAISAKYRTAVSTLGDTAWVKRVPRIYIQGSQGGDTIFRTITAEGGTRSYQLAWNKLTGTQQRRVPIGKGPKSEYWQFEQENVGGSDFSTASVMAFPTKLRRRIAG